MIVSGSKAFTSITTAAKQNLTRSQLFRLNSLPNIQSTPCGTVRTDSDTMHENDKHIIITIPAYHRLINHTHHLLQVHGECKHFSRLAALANCSCRQTQNRVDTQHTSHTNTHEHTHISHTPPSYSLTFSLASKWSDLCSMADI